MTTLGRTLLVLFLGTGLAVLPACDPKVTTPTDTGRPTVEITSPASDDEVSGVAFELQLEVSDNTSRVEIRRGEGAAYDVAVEPTAGQNAMVSAQVLTLSFEPGDLDIQVTAFDANNVASAATSITVDVRARTFVQLTSDTQTDRYPAWSPDGTQILFEANRNGDQFDLWTMNADGTNETRITFDLNEDQRGEWSPDGSEIVWQSDRAGTFDLFVMPAGGPEGDAENLTFPNENNVEPTWTPDGNYLYFASDRGDGNSDYNLWMLNRATRTTTQVTAFDSEEREPTLHPNGQWLAFASDLNTVGLHLYLTEVGSEEFDFLTSEPGVTETAPDFSPYGVIAYTRTAGLNGNIWAILGSREAADQVTSNTSLGGDGGAVWSPDGTKVAFHSGVAGNLDIWVIE